MMQFAYHGASVFPNGSRLAIEPRWPVNQDLVSL